MTEIEIPAERWVQWDGGEIPVHENARVLLSYRDGGKSKVRVAGDLRWEHARLVDDIMAYAVVNAGGAT